MSRRKDLLGQTFNRLTVTGPAPSRRTPSGQLKAYWICACVCGAETEVLAQNLTEGRVKSCGCLLVDVSRARSHDLTNRRFGRLVVIERSRALHDQSTTWLCRCDCGSESTVRTMSLVGGTTLSCGCLRDFMSAHRRWLGDDIGYLGMHDRVRIFRGLARDHACVNCGGKAREWSYNGGAATEKTERVNGYVLAFSTDVNDYSPRCSKCHRRYDIAMRSEVPA